MFARKRQSGHNPVSLNRLSPHPSIPQTMTRKTIGLLVLLLVLTVAYVHFFTDWFRPVAIQITPSVRPVSRLPEGAAAYPVSFALDGKYALTLVKVVSVVEWATNRQAAPLWHLISRSNSLPTRGFTYGLRIRGLKPYQSNAMALPLQPNTAYRLFVEAGRAKGQVDFRPQAVAESAP